MFVEIKDNKLLSWCEKPYLDYSYVDIDYQTFDPDKYELKDGVLTDISDTELYRQKAQQAEKEKALEQLKSQMEQIDLKRIRALAEPMLKDGETGQTWLEYYTQQITNLRNQIAEL